MHLKAAKKLRFLPIFFLNRQLLLLWWWRWCRCNATLWRKRFSRRLERMLHERRDEGKRLLFSMKCQTCQHKQWKVLVAEVAAASVGAAHRRQCDRMATRFCQLLHKTMKNCSTAAKESCQTKGSIICKIAIIHSKNGQALLKLSKVTKYCQIWSHWSNVGSRERSKNFECNPKIQETMDSRMWQHLFLSLSLYAPCLKRVNLKRRKNKSKLFKWMIGSL